MDVLPKISWRLPALPFRGQPLKLFQLFQIALTAWLTFGLPPITNLRLLGNEPVIHNWKTGRDFQEQLDQPVGVTWEATPIRQGLLHLSTSQRVAIFLDRRVDPGRLVTYAAADKPFRQVVQEVAESLGLGLGFVGPVVYVGPTLTSARIATLAELQNERVRELPAGSHERLLTRTPLRWPELTEPRLLLANVASGVGLTIPNIRTLPHDLWPAHDLPPLSFAEKATLILAGFDMSFRFHKNTTQVSLSRFPRAVALERTYRSSRPEELARKIEEKFPQAFVSVLGEEKAVLVKSMLEDHWQIDASQRSGRRRRAKEPPLAQPPQQLFTLNVTDKPLDAVLDVLGKRLELKVDFAEDISPEQRSALVSISVTEVTRDRLVAELAKSAGLIAETDEQSIHILAAPSESRSSR